MIAMHKRRLLAGGAAVAVTSLYVASIGHGVHKACGVSDSGVGALDLQPLIRIGRIYLEGLNKNGSAEVPRKDQFADLLALNHEFKLGDLIAMMGKSQEEFGQGETVMCDGWVLSKSEAQVCAAIALADRYYKAF